MELWKTCRAINNEIRLAMLREIARSPNRELNVLQAGDFVGLKKAAASQYLKQLAEAGFLTVERTGKFVVCSGKPQGGTAFRSSVSCSTLHRTRTGYRNIVTRKVRLWDL